MNDDNVIEGCVRVCACVCVRVCVRVCVCQSLHRRPIPPSDIFPLQYQRSTYPGEAVNKGHIVVHAVGEISHRLAEHDGMCSNSDQMNTPSFIS